MTAISGRAPWYTGLGAREPGEAARAASILMGVAAVLVFVKNTSSQLLFGSAEWGGGSVSGLEFVLTRLVVPVGVLLMAAAVRRPRIARSPYVGSVCAMAMVVLLVVVLVGAGDDAAGSQIFFVLPVIWAAFYLRTLGFVVIAVAAAAGMVAIAQWVTPGGIAGGALVLIASILTTGALIFRERRAAEATERLLELQGNRDALTGLSSRRVLDRVLSERLRSPGTGGLSILLIDMDNLKSVNDTGGHPAGDAVLRSIAALIAAAAGPSDVACRMGGDEFALLLVDRDGDEVVAVAERLCDDSRGIVAGSSGSAGETRMSVSIGVAHVPRDAADVEALYEVADRRLYIAKARGRDQVVMVDRDG